jgi:hypothetical protein
VWPRRPGKAEPTFQVQDLLWGLRVGMFAGNGPSTGKGHKVGALVPQRRSLAIAVSLAGAAGVFVAGVIYSPHRYTMASRDLPGREWVALAMPVVGTPQLQTDAHPKIELAEPATKLTPASSTPPTSLSFIPVSGLASDAPLTPGQPPSRTSHDQPRSGAAFAKRALDQNGVPVGAKPLAQPKRDRSVRTRVYKHDQGTNTDMEILDIVLGEVLQGIWNSADYPPARFVQAGSGKLGNRRVRSASRQTPSKAVSAVDPLPDQVPVSRVRDSTCEAVRDAVAAARGRSRAAQPKHRGRSHCNLTRRTG